MYRNFKLLKIPKAKTLKRVQGDIFRYLFVMLNSFQYLALQKAVAEGDLISPDKPNKLINLNSNVSALSCFPCVSRVVNYYIIFYSFFAFAA